MKFLKSYLKEVGPYSIDYITLMLRKKVMSSVVLVGNPGVVERRTK